MSFKPFDLEYIQSKWEQVVEFNLTESGVHPISLADLLNGDQGKLDQLLATEINYPHVNGNPELRQNIARLYDGATWDKNILVTVGAAEANYIICNTLLGPGDEIATMTPTYKQVWGIAENNGHPVRPFHLRPENGWALDIDDLNRQVNDKTKIIAIVNPNNPSGYIMKEHEMQAIINAADRVGAWILADEVTVVQNGSKKKKPPHFTANMTKFCRWAA